MFNDTFTAQIVGKKAVSNDVFEFLLSPNGGKAAPFGAGAHIDVAFGDAFVRQYSLIYGVPKEVYQIAVRRDANGRGGSLMLCDQVGVGNTVTISQPRNHFALDAGYAHYILLAGGIGITPILSHARQLAERGGSFEVIYAARSRADAAYLAEVETLEASGAVKLHFDDDAGGVFDAANLLSTPRVNTQIYMCGPTAFMDAIEAATSEWPKNSVRKEVFSAAPTEDLGADQSGDFEVELTQSGIRFTVGPDQSIVDQAEAHGITIPTSCRDGICGTCLKAVQVDDPKYLIHRDGVLYDDEKAAGTQIACCVSRGVPGATLRIEA